jgi:hypothetical protein
MSLEGLPHSGIFGSKPVCGSPKLFAAYHALHRLLAPRHSPCALSSLTIRTLELNACQAADYRLQAADPVGLQAARLNSGACQREFQVCTLRVCGRKTTVAEYSVVKERQKQSSASVFYLPAPLTRRLACQPQPRSTRKLRPAKAGEYRARTGDLLVANQALSQLS